jgi:hypothetical protein
MCAPVGSTSSVPLENGDKARKVLKTNESFIVTLYINNNLSSLAESLLVETIMFIFARKFQLQILEGFAAIFARISSTSELIFSVKQFALGNRL